MQLKKIKDNHYIVITDELIDVNEWCVQFYPNGEFKTPSFVVCRNQTFIEEYNNNPNIKKITHSTDLSFNEVYYIPLSYVKELIKKDKRFSEEDLRKVFNMARKHIELGINKVSRAYSYTEDEAISSLTQPKDTWECEFIDGQLKLKV